MAVIDFPIEENGYVHWGSGEIIHKDVLFDSLKKVYGDFVALTAKYIMLTIPDEVLLFPERHKEQITIQKRGNEQPRVVLSNGRILDSVMRVDITLLPDGSFCTLTLAQPHLDIDKLTLDVVSFSTDA